MYSECIPFYAYNSKNKKKIKCFKGCYEILKGFKADVSMWNLDLVRRYF